MDHRFPPLCPQDILPARTTAARDAALARPAPAVDLTILAALVLLAALLAA